MRFKSAYSKLVGARHGVVLAKQAEDVEAIEKDFTRKSEKAWAKINKTAEDLKRPDLGAIEDLLIRNYFESMIVAYKYAEDEEEIVKGPVKRMAKPKTIKTPRSLKDLMKTYDRYRKRGDGGELTKRAQALAENVKKQYLKRLEQIYKRYGAKWQGNAYEFGDPEAQAKAQKAIQQASKAGSSRVKTIVATETTNYVNQARKDLYDSSPDVEGYLFLAVRDSRTTKWCKSRASKWFLKGDPVEPICTPACHWNCRSELVPLSELNPAHKKILADKSRRATIRNVEPLPKGWSK